MTPTLILLFIGVVVLYFLPTGVACERRHRNTNAIFILNALLGWTFVGWVVALVWAYTDNGAGEPIITE